MSANARLSAQYMADPEIRSAVYAFAEDSFRVGNAGQLDDLMRQHLAPFDLATFTFYVATDAQRRPVAAKISGTSNVEWRRHYDANNFADIDDLLHSGLTSSAPTTWARFRQEHVLDRRKRRIYDEAASFGLRDGFYLPLHQPDGSMLGISMMAKQAMPSDRGTLAILHMLSLYYSFAAERLDLIPGKRGGLEAQAELTKRQIECLQWIAAGKSSWEIGEELDLSEYTVNEHLAAARKRLGVKTTTQAVVQAVLRGLVRS